VESQTAFDGGLEKNVHGTLEFDPAAPEKSSVEATLDAPRIWTGEQQRDDHLRSSDFLDVEHHPLITFRGHEVNVSGASEFTVIGDVTIRGLTRKAPLRATYLDVEALRKA
jgi:polyisoprenoid-binding protein YceI